MRILVTGATGQLGRALRDLLGDTNAIFCDRSRLDIARLENVQETLDSERPDLVINAAAYTRVDDAESNIEAAFLGNALGPRNLAIATRARAIPLLHVSTDYVFDGRATRPYHEYDATSPRSVYGRTKLAGEDAIRSLQPEHYIVRTAWLYHHEGANFPQTMIRLAERGEVRVVSDQYGSPTYAPHLAQAILRLIETRAWGTYHVAGQGAASWYELTVRLYAELAFETRVVPVATADFPRPAERPRYSVLTTIQEPKIVLPPWQEGLRAFVERVKSQG